MMENTIAALVSVLVKHLALLTCLLVMQNKKKKKNAFSKNDLTELCHNFKAQGNKVSMAYLL